MFVGYRAERVGLFTYSFDEAAQEVQQFVDTRLQWGGLTGADEDLLDLMAQAATQ